MNCPYCNSDRIQSRGIKNGKRRYECQNKDCGKWFRSDISEEPVKEKKAPKIFVFDIETSLKKAFLFSSGKQYVGGDKFIDDNLMLCWAGKILGDSKIIGDSLTSEEATSRNHSRIIKSLWNELKDVDFTITHNGLQFDELHLRTFFLKERLGLPSKYRKIDTCAISRQNFKFESNRLDSIVKYLGLNDGKIETNFKLWVDCYNGNKKALKDMFVYCKNDISILEDLYNALLPYIPNFPNMGVWGDVDEGVCPYCRSTNFVDNGFIYSPNGKYNSYRCQCQAIFRSKNNLLSNTKRKAQYMAG